MALHGSTNGGWVIPPMLGYTTAMPTPRRADSLLLVWTLAVAALAFVPAVVGISPNIYWDVDPRSDAGAAATMVIGPAGHAWWAVLCALVAAGALATHRAAGGAFDRLSVALIGIGMAFAALHMPAHINNLLRGIEWIGASSLALAAVHLAQHDRPRRLLLAALVAMLLPLAVDSAMFIFHEHPMTVKHFYANEEQFLKSRGWTRGSASHELYIRRLESPDAVGAYGLSNVFGSIIGAMTLLAAALAVPHARQRKWRLAALFAAPAAAGVFTLMLTHSKGAAAAVLGCAALLALAHLRRQWLPAAAMALMIAAFAAVFVRGAMGPPDTHEGERSILFRYHYFQGAARAYAEVPAMEKLTGIGPRGFQAAYHHTKNPLNPEDVDSTHNVFVDYLAMLGLGGLAWSALLVWWLWRSARHAVRAEDDPPSDESVSLLAIDDRDVLRVLALAAIVFGVRLVIERASLTAESFAAQAVGAIAFVAVAAMSMASSLIAQRAAAVGAAVMAAMVLTHAQIEMTFFRDGSAAMVWLMMGVAAAPPRHDEQQALRKPAKSALALPAAVAALAVALALLCALPISRHQTRLAAAAQALRDRDPKTAYEQLGEAAAILPGDPDPRIWQIKLLLETAYGLRARGDLDQARPLLTEALEKVDLVANNLHRARLEMRINSLLAGWFDDADAMPRAIAASKRVVERNPYSLEDHLDLAELQWQTGDHAAAKRTYDRVLTLSDQLYLDPAKQLTDAQRDMVERRMDTP